MAKIYKDQVFWWYGLLYKIIYYQGFQFDAKMMRELYKLLHIKGNLSIVYCPQTDSQTECINQELDHYLQVYINQRQPDWAE